MKHPAGYALLVVLFFVGLIGMLSATYLRHVMSESRNSAASVSSQDAAHAVDAALAWGQQAALTGSNLSNASLGNGRSTAFVQTADLGNGHRKLLASAVDGEGLGSTVLAEGVLMPVAQAGSDDDLPQIDPDIADEIVPHNTNNSHCGNHGSSSVTTTYYSGTQRIANTDLTGLVVIRNSARITFDNVTVAGAIVSEDSLGDAGLGAFNANTAPTVIVDGGLRVSGASFLPGVAVMLPDGVLKCSTNPCSIQLVGDVVAHTITLTGRGCITGNLASVQTASLATGIERPGAGRSPRAWSTALQLGNANSFRYLAFIPRLSTVGSLKAITGFKFK